MLTTLLVFLLILFLVAVGAGLLGSLAGMGGGFMVMPVLLIFFNAPFVEAVGASAVSVLATSITSGAAYVEDRLTDIRIGMFLEIATVPGAFVGIIATILLSKSGYVPLLLILLGVVLLSTLPRTFSHFREEVPEASVQDSLSRRLRLHGKYHDVHLRRDVEYRAHDTRRALGTMFSAGLISGMFGIGSGVLKVTALEHYLRLPMKVATATSNFMIGVTVAAGVSVLFAGGYINPALAAPVALGTALGSWGGSQLLPKISNIAVRFIFVPVLVVLAIEVILRGLGVF
ncbi:MAG: sulfite exporter TauE/SafE family protein [Candidatus Thermoplasmatota archaeon]|jgi:uncharacterized membrane protein YfcA|nr:sulfite exporter TauE/SafE family protein [Candidatus Thermoplasmatota archaeon]MCL5984146.1 sulfite exporter TauE/SafE family protein [Candidatus Thermoplasmatota archaeon]